MFKKGEKILTWDINRDKISEAEVVRDYDGFTYEILRNGVSVATLKPLMYKMNPKGFDELRDRLQMEFFNLEEQLKKLKEIEDETIR